MPLALKELFKTIQIYKNREYIIKLWYIEIYNENIRDLLVNNRKNNEYLKLRESPDKGIIINNVTELITNSSKDILNILKKGNKNRTTEETDSNESSSRSNAILQINVSYKEERKHKDEIMISPSLYYDVYLEKELDAKNYGQLLPKIGQ